MPNPPTSSAVLELLRPVAQQAEQQMAAKVAELLPRIQSGRLSPGDALLNLQRAGENVARDVQAPAGVPQQQARQVARRAARRVLDQAGAQLRAARTQAQQAGIQRTEALLDPVSTLLGGGRGRGNGDSGNRVVAALPFVVVGGGLGAAVAHAMSKSVGTGVALGSLVGAIASFFLGRPAAAPAQAPAGVQIREA